MTPQRKGDAPLPANWELQGVGGTSMRIARAVARLMTNSNLVARATGMSAGFSPLRMRPVWMAALGRHGRYHRRADVEHERMNDLR
jgi:hypothetical protein